MMNKTKGTVLYIGGFELPDKNAAAHRVITIGKIFRELNYRVVYVGVDREAKSSSIDSNKQSYFDFECFAEKYPDNIGRWFNHLVSSKQYIKLIKKLQNVKIVVFYNFQSIAMRRIMAYCKKNRIKCIADVTEWYQPGGNIVYRIFKGVDTSYRMKKLHKKCDVIIAISDYLYKYYKADVTVVKIPPLVDVTDYKWKQFVNEKKKYTFVYAGKASDRKERLDLIIEALSKINQENIDATMQVVGMTKEQYLKMYKKDECPSSVQFWGRVSHIDALKAIYQSEWSIIARERNRVIEAGFPTKVVESISAGVPVCTNKFSNIDEYLDDTNSSMCEKISDIYQAMKNAVEVKVMNVDNSLFDYKNYIQVIAQIID